MEITESIQAAVQEFQALAAKIGPNFNFKSAVEAGLWGSYRSMKLGMTFNGIKQLAGLPVQKRRLTSIPLEERPVRAPRPQNHIPRYHDKRPKGPATKPCLGYADTGSDCKRKVPKGEFFCPRCKARKDSAGLTIQ